MLNRKRESWIALVGLLLAGCVARHEVTPTEVISLLQTGQPLLSCREACLAQWRQAEPHAARLAAARQWSELATLLLRIGYQDDLTTYYVGRAAAGMGYKGAAASYYRQSIQLSGTSISCRDLSRLCGSAILPRDASLRLVAIDRELSRKYGRLGLGPRIPRALSDESMQPLLNEVAGPMQNGGTKTNPDDADQPPSIPAPPSIRPTTPSPPYPVMEFIEPPPIFQFAIER